MVERKQQGAEQQQRQQMLCWVGWLVGWLVVSPRPSLTTATHSLRVRKVPGSWSWSWSLEKNLAMKLASRGGNARAKETPQQKSWGAE
jgi:hypothetical protein